VRGDDLDVVPYLGFEINSYISRLLLRAKHTNSTDATSINAFLDLEILKGLGA
jgi:hypothetical protein